MLKEDVIKRLDELQGCEQTEFVLSGVQHIVYTDTIVNNIAQEVIIAKCIYNENMAIMPYCSIESFSPYHAS